MNPSSIKADLSFGSSLVPVDSPEEVSSLEEFVKKLLLTAFSNNVGIKNRLDELFDKILRDETAEIVKKVTRRVPVPSNKPVKFSSLEEVLEYSVSSAYTSAQVWNVPEPVELKKEDVEKLFQTPFEANITDEMVKDYVMRIQKKVVVQVVEGLGEEMRKNLFNKIIEIFRSALKPDPVEGSHNKAEESAP